MKSFNNSFVDLSVQINNNLFSYNTLLNEKKIKILYLKTKSEILN